MTRPGALVATAALVALLVTPTHVGAQTLGNPGQPFTLSVDPSMPSAYSEVRLTPISGYINITTATMAVTTGLALVRLLGEQVGPADGATEGYTAPSKPSWRHAS